MNDSKLTNSEREAWRQAYMLHEQYHDCGWSPEDWIRLNQQMSQMYEESGQSNLLMHLMIGMLDYFDEQCKKAKAVEQAWQ